MRNTFLCTKIYNQTATGVGLSGETTYYFI